MTKSSAPELSSPEPKAKAVMGKEGKGQEEQEALPGPSQQKGSPRILEQPVAAWPPARGLESPGKTHLEHSSSERSSSERSSGVPPPAGITVNAPPGHLVPATPGPRPNECLSRGLRPTTCPSTHTSIAWHCKGEKRQHPLPRGQTLRRVSEGRHRWSHRV